MIKLLSLFSGMGAFEMALDNIDVDYKLIGFSEIYKPAIKTYCELYDIDESLNLGDITKVDPKTIPDFDLMTYGFPCTSLSCLNLNGKGLADMKRSGLFYEAMRIVEEKQPKYLLAENVPMLLWKDKGSQMRLVEKSLEDLGYKSKYKILNSSYFDTPQNRKRVFIMSIREDIEWDFDFPEEINRTDKRVTDIIDFSIKNRKIPKGMIKFLNPDIPMPKNENTMVIFVTDEIDSRDGLNELYSISRYSPTLIPDGNVPIFNEIKGSLKGKERMRMQGFTDDNYYKIKDLVSENQIASLTGNTIPVKVLEAIFRNLFKNGTKSL